MARVLTVAARLNAAYLAATVRLAGCYHRWQHTQTVQQRPAPEVYTVPPPQPRLAKPGQLAPCQLEQFFEEGYVVVPNFYTRDELQLAIESAKERVSMLVDRLYEGGKIKDKCEGADFSKRMILIEEEFKGAVVLFLKMGFLQSGFQQLWANERALNAVEQMIGPDIGGHPVWNLRVKLPSNDQTTVPWHQDNAYLDPEALYALSPTAWIPFVDTNQHNSCMQVIARGHRKGVTAKHTCCAGGTWYVEVDECEMEKTLDVNVERDTVTCAVPFGGVLFLNNCIPHRSLENHSDAIRWSIDLRWQDPRLPNGFYGLKDNITMRKADDPNYEIDWAGFAAVDRNSLQEASVGRTQVDEFDATIHGPWMRRWEIVHHNQHTKALQDSDPA